MARGGAVAGQLPFPVQRLGTPITTETTVTASDVSTTETVLVTFGTIPANYFNASRGIMARVVARYTGSGVGPTYRFRIRVNGVAGDIVADSGVHAAVSGAQTNAQLYFEAFIQGISGTTVWANGINITPTGAALSVADIAHPLGTGTLGTANSAAVTLTTVAAQTLVLTVEWSANTAGNSITAGPGCYALLV